MENINKYFDAIDIIYWINLDRSIDRKNNMINMLKNIPVKNERIPAIDGKNISLTELNSYFIKKQDNSNINTQIEYACLLSHLNSINLFSNTNYKYALILEDDTTLEYVKYWDKKISDIINEAPADWEMLLLNYTSNNPLENTYELVKNQNIYSAQAYIIKNEFAKKFINKYYINNKFDLTSYDNHSADIFLYNVCKTYSYKYPYFTYSFTNNSTIHEEHLDFHNKAKKIGLLAWKEKYNNINVELFNDNKNIYINYILLALLFILILLTVILNCSLPNF